MAVSADGHSRIAVRKLDSVNTGLKLRELIGAQGRVELLHSAGIGVAGCAELGNLLAADQVRNLFL